MKISNCQVSDYKVFFKRKPIQESFFLLPADLYELKSVIRKIKNCNASGWDDISVKLFLNMPDSALLTLSECIN